MKKYITQSVAGIIISIGLADKEIEGYSEAVIEAFLPTDPFPKNEKKWIVQNNKRMNLICKFLNDQQL